MCDLCSARNVVVVSKPLKLQNKDKCCHQAWPESLCASVRQSSVCIKKVSISLMLLKHIKPHQSFLDRVMILKPAVRNHYAELKQSKEKDYLANKWAVQCSNCRRSRF